MGRHALHTATAFVGVQINRPTALAVDASGAIYIADWGDNTIKKLTPQVRPESAAPRWRLKCVFQQGDVDIAGWRISTVNAPGSPRTSG